MSLNETYTTVLVGKDLSDMFPVKNDLKQGCFTEISSQLYCTIYHYVGSGGGTPEGLKQNGTHQLLIYADNVNILPESIQTTKKNTEDLIVANLGIGLEIKTVEAKYIVISHEHNARQNHTKRYIINPPKGCNSSTIWEQP